MKISILILALVIGMTALHSVNAQDSIHFQSKYVCRIYTDTSDVYSNRTGAIYSVADSGINFSAAVFKDQRIMQYIPSSLIDRIKISRKGKVVRGILIGGGTGFLLGGLLGYAGTSDGDFFSPQDAALILGTLFTIPGMIIGGLIGTSKIEIPINRKQNRYKRQKEEIRRYAIMQ